MRGHVLPKNEFMNYSTRVGVFSDADARVGGPIVNVVEVSKVVH